MLNPGTDAISGRMTALRASDASANGAGGAGAVEADAPEAPSPRGSPRARARSGGAAARAGPALECDVLRELPEQWQPGGVESGVVDGFNVGIGAPGQAGESGCETQVWQQSPRLSMKEPYVDPRKRRANGLAALSYSDVTDEQLSCDSAETHRSVCLLNRCGVLEMCNMVYLTGACKSMCVS